MLLVEMCFLLRQKKFDNFHLCNLLLDFENLCLKLWLLCNYNYLTTILLFSLIFFSITKCVPPIRCGVSAQTMWSWEA